MVDEKIKKPSRAGENTLNLLGTLAGIAGKLVFGPDFNADLGAPFKAGAMLIKQKRDEEGLQELLGSNPETAPVAEHLGALIDAGGLAKNADLLPQLSETLGITANNQPKLEVPTQSPNFGLQQLTGEGISTPEPIQASSQNITPNTTSAPASTPIDYTSPEFIRKAAILRPDIAEELLRIQAKKDPYNDILKALQIQKVQEEPDFFEKQAFIEASKDKRQQQNLENQMLLNNQRNDLAATKRVPISGNLEKALGEYDTTLSNYMIIRDFATKPEFQTKGMTDALKKYAQLEAGQLGAGRAWLGQTNPGLLNFTQALESNSQAYGKLISGAAISEPEMRRLKLTQPSLIDSPSALLGRLNTMEKQTKYLRLSKLYNNAKKYDISSEVDPQEFDKFIIVKKYYQMSNPPKDKETVAIINGLRQELGIDF